MRTAQLHFLGELNDLLPVSKRHTPFLEKIDDHATLKHVIESLGIPHTEIGAVELDGRPANLAARVPDQAEIKIYPFRFPNDHLTQAIQPLAPPGEARFILDIHLGKLAVYLRILGFDCLYQNDYQDDILADLAEKLKRILLSQDRRLLMRNQVQYGYCVRSQNPAQQTLEVVQRYNLSRKVRPLQRCLDCNTPLETVEKEQIQDRLEPLTRRYYHDFRRCPTCKKIYWKGSHYERMRKFINWIQSQPP